MAKRVLAKGVRLDYNIVRRLERVLGAIQSKRSLLANDELVKCLDGHYTLSSLIYCIVKLQIDILEIKYLGLEHEN